MPMITSPHHAQTPLIYHEPPASVFAIDMEWGLAVLNCQCNNNIASAMDKFPLTNKPGGVHYPFLRYGNQSCLRCGFKPWIILPMKKEEANCKECLYLSACECPGFGKKKAGEIMKECNI